MQTHYQIEDRSGVPLIRFPHFLEAGLRCHGITTRQAGASTGDYRSLNLGRKTEDAPTAVQENYRRLATALGFSPGSFVFSDQVHGDRIREVTRQNAAEPVAETDGLMTDAPGLLLSTLYADCMAVLLYDPEHRAIGMVHAGWRGTALNVAGKLVRSMRTAYGSRPEALLGALGPAIGPCCFQVGEEVVSAFKALEPLADPQPWLRPRNGTPFVDLWAANRTLLAAEGVATGNIAQVELCTACHPDLFFSHRRDHGRTGRMAAVMGIEDRL